MGRFKRNSDKNVTKNLIAKKKKLTGGNGKKPIRDLYKNGIYTMDKNGSLELLARGPISMLNELRRAKQHAISRYNPEIHPIIAYDLCYRYNYKLKDLKQVFGETTESVYYWYRHYPEFKEAVMMGKDAYRVDHLEEALIKKATGYKYETVKTEEVLVPMHLPLGGVVEVPAAKKIVTTKQVQPSQSAIEFALTNLKKDRWQPPQQNVKVDSTTKTQEQTIDWNKALEKIGVEGVKQLVGTLKQISVEPAPE